MGDIAAATEPEPTGEWAVPAMVASIPTDAAWHHAFDAVIADLISAVWTFAVGVAEPTFVAWTNAATVVELPFVTALAEAAEEGVAFGICDCAVAAAMRVFVTASAVAAAAASARPCLRARPSRTDHPPASPAEAGPMTRPDVGSRPLGQIPIRTCVAGASSWCPAALEGPEEAAWARNLGDASSCQLVVDVVAVVRPAAAPAHSAVVAAISSIDSASS